MSNRLDFNFPCGRTPRIDTRHRAAQYLGKSRASDNLKGGIAVVTVPGVGMLDLVGKRMGTNLGTSTFVVRSDIGPCGGDFNVGNGGVQFNSGGGDFAGQPIVQAAIITCKSVTNGWYSQPIISNQNNWFSVNEGGSGGGAGLLSQTVEGVTIINSAVRITANEPWFVMVCSLTQTGTGYWLARNMKTGQLLVDVTSGNIPNNQGGTGTQLTVGNNGGATNAFEGWISAAMYNQNLVAMPLPEALKWSEDPWSFWYARPYRPIVALSTVPLAYLRADADDSVSGWCDQTGGTSNLWGAIDEPTASDSDYVISPDDAVVNARFRLSNPVAGRTLTEPIKIRYRYRQTSTVNKSFTVTLLQGSTAIASWMHTGAGLTQTFQTATQTLTTGQAAAITDFDNLFVAFNFGNMFSLVNTAIDFISPESTTHTFANKNIGTPSPTRQVFVGIAASRRSTGAVSSASVTIDGAAMTPVIVTQLDPFYSGIFKANVPTGTTATIVITYNNTVTDTTLGVYAVEGATTSVIDTDFDSAINANFSRTFALCRYLRRRWLRNYLRWHLRVECAHFRLK